MRDLRVKAIVKWHTWVQDCIALNKCIECDDKPVPGEQRCRAHKEWNKARALHWIRTNAERRQEYAKNRLTQRKAAGLCTKCGKRPPRSSVHTRCEPCAKYMRNYR